MVGKYTKLSSKTNQAYTVNVKLPRLVKTLSAALFTVITARWYYFGLDSLFARLSGRCFSSGFMNGLGHVLHPSGRRRGPLTPDAPEGPEVRRQRFRTALIRLEVPTTRFTRPGWTLRGQVRLGTSRDSCCPRQAAVQALS